MNPSILEKLSRLNWPDISVRVLGITIYWSKIYHGANWKVLPKGYTHEDIVQECIRRAFSRDWDSVADEEVIEYLFGAARGIVSNLSRSAKVQNTRSSDLFSLEVVDNSQRIEERFEQEEIIGRIRQELKSQGDISDLFEDMLLGLEPKEIAAKRTVSVTQVYNMKKKLLRIAEKIAKEI